MSGAWTWIAVSPPAQKSRTNFAASRRSVLMRCPGRRGVNADAHRAGDTERGDLAVEIIAGYLGLVVCGH